MPDPLSVLRERYAQPDAAAEVSRQYQALLDAYRPDPVGEPLISSGPQISAGMPWANKAADLASRWIFSQMEGAKRLAETPGAVMQPNPYKEGSEDWYWYEDQRAKAAQEFGPAMGLNVVLAGTGNTPVAPGEVMFGAGRRRLPPRPSFEDIPPPPIGHNMPPPEFALTPEAPPRAAAPVAPEAVVAPPEAPPRTWAQDLPRPKPAARSTEIPDIRGLPVEDAIAIARNQHHLIKAGEQSEGFYVGAPRDATSKRWLNAQRKAFDDYIAADPRGGDWYNRYRSGQSEVTGGDPIQNQWMSAQEGQWSAGVDPGSELAFALKENNAAIAGMPVKAARPAQHEAHMRAIASQDPGKYQLGKKTGEYAGLVNPDRPGPAGATGVNDFRHARNWGYTEATGEAQKGALTDAAHKFLDYETALAVDRANKSNLGGRSDWTGEQLQAAPWVRQKALDIQERGGRNADGSFKMTYEEAFQRANMTIADYFNKHTAFATHEAVPGEATGHLAGSIPASQAERVAYTADPASTWATAPGGRDAIYAGMGVPGTGNYMRVRPSREMQGYYPTERGIETNPGFAARPLVAFETGKGGNKTVAAADQTLLNAGEAVRAYVDAQNAGAWHKPWVGGRAMDSNSLFFPRRGPSNPEEMSALNTLATRYGLTDVADTGQGITTTSFWPKPDAATGKAVGKAVKKGEFGNFGEPVRVKVDSDIVDFVDEWKAGHGSGAATTKLLDYVNKTPELRTALNENPYLAERAMAKLARDDKWASKWGAPREDIQNARRIIGTGPGWIDKLEAGLKSGAVLPAVAAAILGTAQLGAWRREEY